MQRDALDYDPLRGAPLGRAHFRALSFCFEVDWNDDVFEGPVRRALGPLEVPGGRCSGDRCPPPERVPTYHLADISGGGGLGYAVFRDRELLYQSESMSSLVDYFFWRVNSQVVDSARDFFLIHAGAVASASDEGVVLPGASGAGKSSLVLALVRSGFRYLSDEFTALDPVHRRIHAFPKAATLKSGSFPLYPEVVAASRGHGPEPKQVHVLPADVGGAFCLEPISARFVVVPTFQSGAATSVEQLSRGEALVDLVSCSLGMGFYGARGLSLLRDLVAECTCIRLAYSDLHEAVHAVVELTAPATL